MTSEYLLDAIGQMDDDLILGAAAPVRRAIPWAKVSGLAAAVLLCVGLAHIPGLLPMKGLSSGTAAPEVGGLLNDAVMDQDAENAFEYRSEQESQVQTPSAANKSESVTADGASQGVFEPRFFTERGVYLPIVLDSGSIKQKTSPPESASPLGNLVSAVPGEQAYPSTGTQELVGCPVWESEDRDYLYIQLPDGDWLTAKRYQ